MLAVRRRDFFLLLRCREMAVFWGFLNQYKPLSVVRLFGGDHIIARLFSRYWTHNRFYLNIYLINEIQCTGLDKVFNELVPGAIKIICVRRLLLLYLDCFRELVFIVCSLLVLPFFFFFCVKCWNDIVYFFVICWFWCDHDAWKQTIRVYTIVYFFNKMILHAPLFLGCFGSVKFVWKNRFIRATCFFPANELFIDNNLLIII